MTSLQSNIVHHDISPENELLEVFGSKAVRAPIQYFRRGTVQDIPS